MNLEIIIPIEITEEHIEKGKTDCEDCPIALAIKECCGLNIIEIYVTVNGIHITYNNNNEKIWTICDKLTDFIHDFDFIDFVYPTTGYLSINAKELKKVPF